MSAAPFVFSPSSASHCDDGPCVKRSHGTAMGPSPPLAIVKRFATEANEKRTRSIDMPGPDHSQSLDAEPLFLRSQVDKGGLSFVVRKGRV